MKRTLSLVTIFVGIGGAITVQDLKPSAVPAIVRTALARKYPSASKVSWEKEKGNYEANWGGKSGEDNSVVFSPDGSFIEIVNAMPEAGLSQKIQSFIRQKYKNAKIIEAAKVTDSGNKLSYEVEIRGAELIFDKDGNFVKKE